jgi:DNA polymerase III alpha subunit (gram-positive type)
MPEPQIVYFDIETTPGLFYGFRLGKQRVEWTQIRKEPVVCCICWSVNGGKIQSATFDLKKYNINAYDDTSDLEMIKKFVGVVNKADALVGHNGKNFDVAFLRNRIIKHRLPDIAPVIIDDTYLKTKGIRTLSHKLGYLLHYYGIGEKGKHEGLPMWIDVVNGDKKALADMVTYCKDDVKGLISLHEYIKPYVNVPRTTRLLP